MHKGVIRRFVQEDFIVSDGVVFDPPKGGYVSVHGQIQCLSGLNIDVEEKLKVVSRERGNVRVVREGYKYNVSVSGRGNRFRHDGGHPDHSQRPHEHRFDSRGQQTSRLEIDEGSALPTLGDVIDETRELYWSPEFAKENDQLPDDAEES